MSRLGYIASVPLQRFPVTGFPPGSHKFCLFPGFAETSETKEPTAFSAFPVRGNYKTFLEVWHRVRRIKATFNFVNGSISIANSTGMEITPLPVPDNEIKRVYLQNNNWYSRFDQSTGGDNRTIDFNVYLLNAQGQFLAPPAPQDTRYFWRTDLSPNEMLPMMAVRIQCSWEQGGDDLTFDLNTSDEPPPGSRGAFYFTGSLDFFGIPVQFWCDPDIAHSVCDVSFSGEEWWPYKDADGNNPIWDSLTGNQLRIQWPISGPNALL